MKKKIPKFCRMCGEPLVKRTSSWFNPYTGKRQVILKCRSVTPEFGNLDCENIFKQVPGAEIPEKEILSGKRQFPKWWEFWK